MLSPTQPHSILKRQTEKFLRRAVLRSLYAVPVHSCDKIQPLSVQEKWFSHCYGYVLGCSVSVALDSEKRKKKPYLLR